MITTRRLGTVLTSTMLVGCLDGEAAQFDGASEAGATDGAGDGDSTGPEPGSVGSTDASDTITGPNDPDTSGGVDDTSDESTGGTGPEVDTACDVFDCGRGTCFIDRDGTPGCLCVEPEIGVGLQCLTCSNVADSYDIAVAGTDVTITLTLDGEPLNTADTETALVSLRNPASGEVIVLGDTNATSVGARVLPTGYEVLYGYQLGAVIPVNREAVLGFLDARSGTEVALAFDLHATVLDGEFRFDGALAPVDESENGRVWLRSATSGDQIYLGETRLQTFQAYVLAGDYQIEFESLAGGGVAPLNRRARVGTLTVPADTPSHTENVEIATTVASGSYFVDGAAAPADDSERARISLRDPLTGDEFPIGETDTGEFAVRVVPGTYDVVYRWLSGSGVMPANTHAVVGALDTTDPATHDVHIDTVAVSGAFTIDGAAPPTNPNDDGRLFLRDEADGDVVQLGSTTVGGFGRIVVAGAYAVHYAQDTSSGTVPANANARLEVVDVGAEPSFDIDVPTAYISGVITIGLDVPPASDYDDGWVYLRNADTGDTVLLANTRLGLYGVSVVPGFYEVVYAVETPGGQVPINVDSVVLDTVEVAGPTQLDIDIPVRGIGGAIGAPAGPGESGSLYLQAVGRDDRSLLGNTAAGTYDQPVIPGRYLVSYGVDASMGSLPVNTNGPIACIDVAAP